MNPLKLFFGFVLAMAFFCAGAQAADAVKFPKDSLGRYEVLTLKKTPEGKVEFTFSRTGPPKDYFAKRIVDCADNSFIFAGFGDTKEEMEKSVPETIPRHSMKDSLSGDLSDYACTHVDQPAKEKK